MTAKILVTLAWAAVLVGANKLLAGTEWAQYVATFVLGGAYVLLINKVSKPPARNDQN
ncbi:hypothetical protein QQM39_22855 [Streptomyces sp. DT2A-34]|uniref:hypothetical protein n=1 Tax=Streptomyces sp. DT2A-34 TaxID=3051182 RepID=UPI00265C6343|nr:hypothetical protein [Streptomyces sp. DT2A-34]MDO0913577.1 hypothetical protein [Streptomyces sp. DT2A-34]